jgi:glycosyltransferase involved in cell wall biosynthesis
VPIWGIGSWAVVEWRREFGGDRLYFNVPYFSNLERFRFPFRELREPGRRKILYSGSLIDRKGVDLLATAFSMIAREFPGVSLTVVGTGTREDEMRAKLGHLSDRVTFEGFKPWDELPPVYRDADLLCAPSRYDGWGLIVPEGLASGLPVIATDRTGSAHDLIDPGINGWIVSAGELDSLLVALREAVTLNSDRFTQMSLESSRSVAGHSLERGASRFVEACRETLAAFGMNR